MKYIPSQFKLFYLIFLIQDVLFDLSNQPNYLDMPKLDGENEHGNTEDRFTDVIANNKLISHLCSTLDSYIGSDYIDSGITDSRYARDC